MKYNPDIHHRRSIRLPGYDYSQPGAYFVTTNIWQGEIALGQLIHNVMQLNRFGMVVKTRLLKLPFQYPNMRLDTFIVMPDHVHLIIELIDHPSSHVAVPEIVGRFKTDSARQINQERSVAGRPVWQRNYYEHIIRNAEEWQAIRDYILTNPDHWQEGRGS